MRRVLLLALLAWAATPAAASAHALMSTANGILRLTDGDTISRNTVSVTAEGKQARITDTTSDGGLGPGSAFDICIPITERELLCDVRKIRVIRIDVGSDDDTVTYRHPLPARIFGGGGHDVLRGGRRARRDRRRRRSRSRGGRAGRGRGRRRRRRRRGARRRGR